MDGYNPLLGRPSRHAPLRAAARLPGVEVTICIVCGDQQNRISESVGSRVGFRSRSWPVCGDQPRVCSCWRHSACKRNACASPHVGLDLRLPHSDGVVAGNVGIVLAEHSYVASVLDRGSWWRSCTFWERADRGAGSGRLASDLAGADRCSLYRLRGIVVLVCRSSSPLAMTAAWFLAGVGVALRVACGGMGGRNGYTKRNTGVASHAPRPRAMQMLAVSDVHRDWHHQVNGTGWCSHPELLSALIYLTLADRGRVFAYVSP